MWKESYRIGVDLIDRQHMELFKMAGHLLDVVRSGGGNNKDEWVSALSYLKEYTLRHFHDEEEYQKSIHYHGYPEHRQIHKKFVQDVLEHERKMTISNFSTPDVKDFMGTLIAWLVYHVAGADQDIIAGRGPVTEPKPHIPVDSFFYICVCDILSKVSGLDTRGIKVISHADGDMQAAVSVKVQLHGDVTGTISFRYIQELAFFLMNRMASFTPAAIDELVCSAMQEITQIISIKAVGMMSTRGISCHPQTPVVQIHPAFLPAKGTTVFNTGAGLLEMELDIE